MKFILIILFTLSCFIFVDITRAETPKYGRYYSPSGQRMGGYKIDNGWKHYFNRSGTITGRERIPQPSRYRDRRK